MSELVKTKGIVLNYLKYGDNHLIANIFTQTHSRLSFFIKGSAKKKNKYKNILQPLNIVHLEFLFSPKKELHYFKSMEIEFANDFFLSQQKSSIAFLLSDFFDKLTLRQAPSTDFFSFILEAIRQLNNPDTKIQYLFLQTLTTSLHLMGLAPTVPQNAVYFNLQTGYFTSIASNDNHLSKEETAYFIQLLSNKSFEHLVEIPANIRLPLIEHLLYFYQYHLNIGKLSGYDIIKAMYLK
jgi:DNA repair protein RecO (recombination protein O)